MQEINIKLVWRKIFTIGPPLLFAAYLIKWIFNLLLKNSNVNAGGDFLQYWVASSLATSGKPLIVFDFTLFNKILAEVAGKPFPLAWFYPPTFLVMILPLSLLPYSVSLITWLSIPLFMYVLVVRRIAPDPATIWLTLAFPATLLNIGYGQNGFLSACLFGGGLLLLDHHPYLSGLIFGFFTYKPHLFILIPFALIAGRHWKALWALILSFGCLVLISVYTVGGESWLFFLRNIIIATAVLERGSQGYVQSWDKMVTFFSVTRLTGIVVPVAYILQGTVMLGAFGVTIWVWFRGASFAIRASVLTLCALIFTPHAFAYDLTILILPLAWIGWEGHTKGWLGWEQAVLFLGWWVPLFSVLPGKPINLLLIPLIIMVLLFFALRRWMIENANSVVEKETSNAYVKTGQYLDI